MAERFKALVSKTSWGETPSEVRILPLPKLNEMKLRRRNPVMRAYASMIRAACVLPFDGLGATVVFVWMR